MLGHCLVWSAQDCFCRVIALFGLFRIASAGGIGCSVCSGAFCCACAQLYCSSCAPRGEMGKQVRQAIL